MTTSKPPISDRIQRAAEMVFGTLSEPKVVAGPGLAYVVVIREGRGSRNRLVSVTYDVTIQGNTFVFSSKDPGAVTRRTRG